MQLFRWGTTVTPVRMNTDCCAALRTFVFLFLTVEEFLHPIGLNEIQILDHTQVVFLRIAIVKFLKMCTGII